MGLLLFVLTTWWARRCIEGAMNVASKVRPENISGGFDLEVLKDVKLPSLFDRKVLFNTLYIILPVILYFLGVRGFVLDFSIYVSIFVFFAPFAMPTSSVEVKADLASLRYFISWLITTFDVWLKLLVLSSVMHLLLKIGFLSEVWGGVKNGMFPPFKSDLFLDFSNEALLISMLMMIFYWLFLFHYGSFVVLLFSICQPVSFVFFCFIIQEIVLVDATVTYGFWGVVFSGIIFSFLVGLLYDAIKSSKQRDSSQKENF